MDPARGGWRRLAAALGLAAAASGCAPLTIPQERELGARVQGQVRDQVTLLGDRVVDEYVEAIGRRILDAAGPQPFTYRFYVVDDEAINAFALPAGYIYVYTGILLQAQDASEVAGVVAHEVGHVVERHVAENHARQQGVGVLYRIGVYLTALLGGGAAAQAANVGGGLASLVYLNSFSREAEREADAFAVHVLPRAGYDPRGMIRFFRTLLRESGGGPPAFLSSHPTTEERIERAQALVAAQDLPPGLASHDGGRLEIVQRRIRLLQRR